MEKEKTPIDALILTASGNECFNPSFPDCFEFGDYSYHIEDVNNLNENQILAITRENPWNIDDIMKNT